MRPYRKKRNARIASCEQLEVRQLLAIDFQFIYEGAIVPGGIGFQDPNNGQARRDALDSVGTAFGAFFENDATVNVFVESVVDSDSGALAGAASYFVNDNEPGFTHLVMPLKILSGIDVNGIVPDGLVRVNWANSWELADDFQSGEYDFTFVIMHELAHALGFSSVIAEDGSSELTETALGQPGRWSVFDSFVSDSNGNPLISDEDFILDSSWNTLSVGGTSPNNGLFFNGYNAITANSGQPVGLYSPTTWEDGSSGSHLDTDNSDFTSLMMAHEVGTGIKPRILSPVEMAIFRDLGYTMTGVPSVAPVLSGDSGAGFATNEDTSVLLPNTLLNDFDPDPNETETLRITSVDTLAAGGSVSIVGTGLPTSFSYSVGPDPITDDGQVNQYSIDISGFEGRLRDVNVAFDINHTWDSDLQIDLISPAGTRVELLSRVGGDGDNFTSTVISDQAVLAIDEYAYESGQFLLSLAPFSGTFRPEGTLADFNGELANGSWVLEITDLAADDPGQLIDWSLILTGQHLVYDPNGQFESLNDGETSTDSFTYTVADVNGNTSTATVTVDIAGVTDINLPPILDSNTGLTLGEGNAATITSQALAASDPDNDDASLSFTLTDMPTNGDLLLNGSPLAVSETFTQGDIDNALLSYAHDDSNTTTDSFSFTVADPAGNSLAEATFQLVITPEDDDPPALAINSGLTLAEGDSATISNIHLAATDPDSDDASLIFTLAGVPANGQLLLNGSPLALDDAFTQADVDNALLSYGHDDSNTIADSFSFTVADPAGNTLAGQTFQLVISPEDDDPPVITANIGVTLPEGDTATISNSRLAASDPDTNDELLIFTVTNVPLNGVVHRNGNPLSIGGTFTQGDIDNALLSYAHDDSNTIADSFSFTVADPAGNDLPEMAFQVTITPVDDDPPVLVANAGLTLLEGETQPITAGELAATDPDSSDAALEFTVTAAPTNGELLLGGNPLSVGGMFTQGDIDNELLSYTHDGSNTSNDDFTVTVADPASNSLGPQAFQISINAEDDDPPTLLNNTGLTLAEGDAATITTGQLAATDPDSNDTALIFTVTAVPLNGELLLSGNPLAVGGTFTQSDLVDEQINYDHGGSNTTTDSFSFTIADPAGNGLAAQSFHVTVTPVDDDPPTLAANNPLSVTRGATGMITSGELAATDSDTDDTSLIFTLSAVPLSGELLLGGTPLSSGSSFTQSDIDYDQLNYSHDGSSPTADAFTFTVADPAGNALADQTFQITVAAPLDGTIEGQKFHDINGDGVRDLGESGLNGWVIELVDSSGSVIATTTTADLDLSGNGTIEPETERGAYRFENVAVGDYRVREVSQMDWLPSLANRDDVEAASSNNIRSIATLDLEQDGDLDLAVSVPASNAVTILVNDGTGAFVRAPLPLFVGAGAGDIVSADFNGDGRDDLATANQSAHSISIRINDGGSFSSRPSPATADIPVGIAAADVDDDDDIDLVVTVAGGSNSIAVYLNDGAGNFPSTASIVHTVIGVQTPRDIVLADLDGDAFLDAAATYVNSDKLAIVFDVGTIAPSFLRPDVGSVPAGIAAIDIDNDSDFDLAVANRDSNTVSVLENLGSGTFAAATSFLTGSAPIGIDAGDLDGDGDTDLLTANRGDNSFTLLGNQPLGNLLISTSPGSGTDPEEVLTADFDLDGDLDVAVSNAASRDVSIFTNSLIQPVTVNAGAVSRIDIGNIDLTPPTVAVTRTAAEKTNADSVVFRLTFSEPILGVDVTDVGLLHDPAVTANAVVTVDDLNDGDETTFEVTVSGINGDGSLTLEFLATGDIVDSAGNSLSLMPTVGESYLIDNTSPALTAIRRFDPAESPTDADTLIFRAEFSEPVENIDEADFVVDGGSTAVVSTVSMISADVYEITLAGGDLAEFDGEVGLNLSPSVTINDTATNPIDASEPPIDEVYLVENVIVLTLEIDLAVVGEEVGPGAATVTITRSGSTDDPLVISLLSDDTTEIEVPAEVTIPSGESQITFDVATHNDFLIDGLQTATITATADDALTTTLDIDVTDDDSPGVLTIGGRFGDSRPVGSNALPAEVYRVTFDLEVVEGESWTLPPAATLSFDTDAGLTVSGVLSAVGTTDDPIEFTSAQPLPAPGDWEGILIDSVSTTRSVLSFIEVSYGDNGVIVSPGRGPTLQNPNIRPLVTVSDSDIHHNANNGVVVTAGSFFEGETIREQDVLIVRSHIHHNGSEGVSINANSGNYTGAPGASARNDTSVIGNEIAHNGRAGIRVSALTAFRAFGGIAAASSVAPIIDSNHIHHNLAGVELRNTPGRDFMFVNGQLIVIENERDTAYNAAQLSNNLIEANSGNGVTLSEYSDDHPMFPTIINNTIVGNGAAGVAHGTTHEPFELINNMIVQNADGVVGPDSYAPAADSVSNNLLFGNTVSDFTNYPASFGLINTTNGNGTASDAHANIFVDPLFVGGGDYHLLPASPARDAGLAGANAPATDADGEARTSIPDIGYDEVLDPAAAIVGRHLFYGGSSFAAVSDDNAIASDKSALIPGDAATFANYSSYVHGITGVMIDVANLPGGAVLDPAVDFSFAVGNDGAPESWSELAVTPSIDIRPGGGDLGSDRIVLTWPDGTITSTWLEINLHAGANSGLLADDQFYFGNAPGETGDSANNAIVNGADFMATRQNPKSFLSPASITDPYDFNRDQRVDAIDMLIARDYATAMANSLSLISPPAALGKSGQLLFSASQVESGEAKVATPAQPVDAVETFEPVATAIDRLMVSMAASQREAEADEIDPSGITQKKLAQLIDSLLAEGWGE